MIGGIGDTVLQPLRPDGFHKPFSPLLIGGIGDTGTGLQRRQWWQPFSPLLIGGIGDTLSQITHGVGVVTFSPLLIGGIGDTAGAARPPRTFFSFQSPIDRGNR